MKSILIIMFLVVSFNLYAQFNLKVYHGKKTDALAMTLSEERTIVVKESSSFGSPQTFESGIKNVDCGIKMATGFSEKVIRYFVFCADKNRSNFSSISGECPKKDNVKKYAECKKNTLKNVNFSFHKNKQKISVKLNQE